MKLTAKTIDTIQIPDGKSEHIVYDDEIAGFGVRVRAGGSRTLIYQYKLGTKNRRMTLGAAVKEAFPDIRKRVIQLQSQVHLGTDPAAAKEQSVRNAAETFEVIARRFLAQLPKKVKKNGQKIRQKTVVEIERYLLTVAKPLHSMSLATIARRDIASALSAASASVTKGDGEVTANRLRSALSGMFAWAIGEGLIEENPVIGTNARGESPRDRCLVDLETGDISELVAVWKALGDTPFDDIVRLLILTGQRRSEIGGLQWSELDNGYTRIKLPKHRTKNGVEHLIPLSQPARDILTRQPQIVGSQGVFGRTDRGFTAWDVAKTALDKKLPDMPHWTLHDLRRSVATGLSKCVKQLPHVIEAVTNHQSGSKAGVAGIYNLDTYLPEKTAALTLWAEHLMAAVSGKSAKVVPLRA